MAEYFKTGALKACDVVESRFFSDGRDYIAGSSFTAAGGFERLLAFGAAL